MYYDFSNRQENTVALDQLIEFGESFSGKKVEYRVPVFNLLLLPPRPRNLSKSGPDEAV